MPHPVFIKPDFIVLMHLVKQVLYTDEVSCLLLALPSSVFSIVVTDEERTFFRITIPCHEAAGNIIADIASKDNHDPKDDPKDDPKELSERQLLILDIIKKDDLITILQMVQKITVSEKTIKRELAILQEKGVLTREGGRKEGKWVINKKSQ